MTSSVESASSASREVTKTSTTRLQTFRTPDFGVLGHADAGAADLVAATSALETCGARMAVVDRLCRLCDEAEALAESLPVASAARNILAGSASALRPRMEDTWGSSVSMVIG